MKDSKKVEDFLEHYGILGMKWGRRKGGSSSGASKKTKSKIDPNEHENSKNKKRLLNKKVSSLSNTELQEVITRLNLEKNYKLLTTKDLSPGKKFVKEILMTSAKQQLANFITKQGTELIGKAISRRSA